MTFHFAHMAPPGRQGRRATTTRPAIRWVRNAQTGQLAMRWTQPQAVPPALPAQAAPGVETLLDALLRRQSYLRRA